MTSPFRPRYFLPGLLNATVPVPSLDPQQSPLASAGNGPIAGYTNSFGLNLVNFDWITWHNYEWENWIVVDALLSAAIGFLNIKGFWKPNTDYLAGQSVFDPDDITKLYLCIIPHTSTTDFDADKPLYWNLTEQARPPVNSVFGRIGDVLALVGDYAAFYADKVQTEAHIADSGNPHETSWGNLLGKPATFPPSTHTHVEADITNLDKYTKAEVDAIEDALRDDFEAADSALLGNINTRVLRAGDTLTGFLLLHAIPTALMHAANKGYVDTQVATKLSQAQADARYLQLSGGTLTGLLTLSGAPTADLHAATKKYVDDNAGGGGGGTSVHVGDNPPASPVQGQQWFKTIDPVGMYVWYVDADSAQWVQIGGSGVPPFASNAEAIAGTVTDKGMSPATTKAVTDALPKPLGVAQTWQTIPPASRPVDTPHQNTTTRPIMVAISGRSGSTASRIVQVSANGTDWVQVGSQPNNTSSPTQTSFVLPAGHFWRIVGSMDAANYLVSELS